jgi:putative ABC transport system substrate-binding protein
VKRREFITLLGGAAVAWPIAARAQQSAMPVIGFLTSGSPGSSRDALAGFYRGLAQAGFVEHQNVAIEYRWAEGDYARFPSLAAELVQRQVTLIVAITTQAAVAAQAVTTTIPIIFYAGLDPVVMGFVTSFNRPGGNLTGLSQLSGILGPKRLEVLHELLPKASNVAVLINPASPLAESQIRNAQEAARALGFQLSVLSARTDSDLQVVFEALEQQRADGLVVEGDAFFNSRRDQLVALAARSQIPAVYEFREFVVAGGLCSYGTNNPDVFRQLGFYAGRVLKGEKPAELPVMQPTKFELVINLQTAKALGLDVPATLLARADEVIE